MSVAKLLPTGQVCAAFSLIAFYSVEYSLPKFTTMSNASTFVPSTFIVFLFLHLHLGFQIYFSMPHSQCK